MDCVMEYLGHNPACISQSPSNALPHYESLQKNVSCSVYIRSRNTFLRYNRAIWRGQTGCDTGFEIFRLT